MAVRNNKKIEEDYNREIGSAGTSNDQSHWQRWNKRNGMKMGQPVWEPRCFSPWCLSLLFNLSLLFPSFLSSPSLSLYSFLSLTVAYMWDKTLNFLKQVEVVSQCFSLERFEKILYLRLSCYVLIYLSPPFYFFGFVYLPLTVKSSHSMCRRGLLSSCQDEITAYTLCMQNAGWGACPLK